MKYIRCLSIVATTLGIAFAVACGGTEEDLNSQESGEAEASVRAAGYSTGSSTTRSNCSGAFGSNCGTAYGSSSYGGGGGGGGGGGAGGGGNGSNTGGTRGYGQQCSYDSNCISTLVCRDARCQNLGGIRSRCARDSECLTGLVCNSLTAQCANPGGNYTRCGRDGDCLSGLSCNYTRGYCSAY